MAKKRVPEPSETGAKRVPNSLREVLFLILNDQYGGTATKLRPFLEAAYVKYHPTGKNVPQKLEHDYISRIEDGLSDLPYWQIEAFAAASGLPAGVLLLFSRFRSNVRPSPDRERNVEENQKIIFALREILDSLNPEADFDETLLRDWTDQFRKNGL